jgi:dienelactone hydrolase
MPVTEQRQTFKSGGRTIAVDVFQAGLPARRPAVLMLHGADGLQGHTQYLDAARHVAAAGYHVHLVHYLDRTGERRASFGTLFQNFQLWMDTVNDALAFVASHAITDPDRVGLVGISLGSALGLAVASADRRIKAMVSYFGPLPQGAIAQDAKLPPTLILHGGMDPIVPVANAYAIEALLRQHGVPHEVKVYPEQAHGFRGEAQRDATQRALAFLQRHLPPVRVDAGSSPLPAGG